MLNSAAGQGKMNISNSLAFIKSNIACMQTRSMSVVKVGKTILRKNVLKDMESKKRRIQHAREAKARNVSDLDKHVQQAYKELELENAKGNK
mmetsp:Transcript_27532/g.89674  ORF Transcript_27532/g.89674 Transcript_27532/m.89674 type:complete len:92 (-) Transcript_27532:104-379(-)